MTETDVVLLERIWCELAGASPGIAGRNAPAAGSSPSSPVPPSVVFSGPARVMPSAYDVAALASAAVGAATASVAALWAIRTGRPERTAYVDRTHAAVAFRSERYFEPIGWTLPPGWDPIAGDYAARDGWIRLHTNYRNHRDAVHRVLGAAQSRDAVAAAVRSWTAEDLEAAVVAQGGCAARCRTAAEWSAHPQGVAVAAEPLFGALAWPARAFELAGLGDRPLEGVRVLDLTRVLAGPVCTRFLAAYGADVLRVDPKGFDEVASLVPEMTAGKRRARMDLRDPPDRLAFERLLAAAHVFVHGYRSDALARLGFGVERRRAINASLVDVSLDAYGFTGPWAQRRGFDSLVQMSSGIAARGREVTGRDRPFPLPAQALDHGCGYLLAAAACRGLALALVDREAVMFRLSLARVAKLLTDLGDGGDVAGRDLRTEDVEPWRETAQSAFGPVRRVRCPGRLDGIDPSWVIPAGPLGSDAPAWA